MSQLLIRAGILILVGLVTYLIVRSGRRFVEMQRQHALAALPPGVFSNAGSAEIFSNPATVRILVFSSADCAQCHQLQAPALERVMQAYGDKVTLLEVDAPNEPELTERYRILTVPSTVVLDAAGHAHAVNYGFANTQKLLAQVDEAFCV
jgi:thiol-disulfide isomerase/thioredoxin